MLLVRYQDHEKLKTASEKTKKQTTASLPDGENESPHSGLSLNEDDQEYERDKSKVIILRQSWFDTPCTTGDYVHLIGSFEDEATTGRSIAIVDDQRSMLILHPDQLISATVVADSFGCVRRAVLQDRVRATNEPSEAQVYGQILHEVFQAGLRANRWDGPWLGGVILEDIVRRHHLENLYQIKIDVPQALAHLRGKITEFQAWADLFVSDEPKVCFECPPCYQ